MRHADVRAPLNAGLPDSNEDGGFAFTYDRVRVDFTFDRDAA